MRHPMRLLPSNDDDGGNGQPEPAACHVDVSSLSKTCATDQDCVAVGQGDMCAEPCLGCPTLLISKSAYADYQAMVAAVPYDAGSITCNCPSEPVPKCCSGTCCP